MKHISRSRMRRKAKAWGPWIAGATGILAILMIAVLVQRGYDSDVGAEPSKVAQKTTIGLPSGKFSYVALGDSFVAGPGIPRPARESVPGCDNSTGNYARRLAVSIHAASFKDDSCSGATTGNFSARQRASTAPTYNLPQLDSLSKSTDVVTITAGLNNIEWISVLAHCAAADGKPAPDATCEKKFSDRNVDFAARADVAGEAVAKTLKAVSARAPRAHIALVGYPRISEASDSCAAEMGMSPADLSWAAGVEQHLNDALSSAADSAGAAFVDVYAASAGHGACSGASRWVEPALPAQPKSGPYALHPNAVGARAIAALVASRMH